MKDIHAGYCQDVTLQVASSISERVSFSHRVSVVRVGVYPLPILSLLNPSVMKSIRLMKHVPVMRLLLLPMLVLVIQSASAEDKAPAQQMLGGIEQVIQTFLGMVTQFSKSSPSGGASGGGGGGAAAGSAPPAATPAAAPAAAAPPPAAK